jgi:hypothetical protein
VWRYEILIFIRGPTYIPRCQVPSSVSVLRNLVQLYFSVLRNIKKLEEDIMFSCIAHNHNLYKHPKWKILNIKFILFFPE